VKGKIFLWCNPAAGWGERDVIGYAIAEDGEGLASHLSSSESFARHDMGLTSTWKHDVYAAKYPDGYELVWLTRQEQDANDDFKRAIAINQQKNAPEGEGASQ
jgi:hypothetical protein